MKRITRDRRLTPEEAAKYQALREQVAGELTDLIAQHHQREAASDPLREVQPASPVRVKTGEICPVSGVYRFDGHLDGTDNTDLAAQECMIPLAKSNIVPPLRSSNKSCNWLLVRAV